jgi:hypothetical protein
MEALAYTHVAVHYEELNSSSELRAFRNIKLKVLKVVKSIAIAIGCITTGVVAGTEAQALTTSGGKLTLRNDTQSEVLIFLHKDGESGAYTRYAYLPACTERTMLGDYSHGWHISQDLRWKLPLIPKQTGIAKVYTSSFNGVKYEKLCQRAIRSVGPTYMSGLGWGMEPASATTVLVNVNSLRFQLLGMIDPAIMDQFLNTQTLTQAKKIGGDLGEWAKKVENDLKNLLTSGWTSFTRFLNNLEQTVSGGTKEAKKGADVISPDTVNQNWFLQQKKTNADKLFEQQALNVLTGQTHNDDASKIAERIRLLRELADREDLDGLKKVLKDICNLLNVTNAHIAAQSLIKAAQISNSQNLGKMNKAAKEGGAMVEVERMAGGLEGLDNATIKERYCPRSDGENRQRVERKDYI